MPLSKLFNSSLRFITVYILIKSQVASNYQEKACPTTFSETSHSLSASLLDTARG